MHNPPFVYQFLDASIDSFADLAGAPAMPRWF